MLIGVIADDFTGASDIAATLVKGLAPEGGLRTAQYLGVPRGPADSEVEAGVVSLKSRSIPAAEAVAQSLAACRWLLDQGARQIVFKYCSTFDSTEAGNIGPVAEALATLLDARGVVVCPAFPENGRTVYEGHLFVNDVLLNESGMQHHPLTPMTDPDIRRVLRAQSSAPVGHVRHRVVSAGASAVQQALEAATAEGEVLVVVDAIDSEDLASIGLAAASARLITGGSGIARGLPRNFLAGRAAQSPAATLSRPSGGSEVVLAGSCSRATRGQIARHREAHPWLKLDVDAVMAGDDPIERLVGFALDNAGHAPLIYSSDDPDQIAEAQRRYGGGVVAEALDGLFGRLASTLVTRGVTRIVVAGGETSGAVVSALDLDALHVGAEIDPGVPVLIAGQPARLALALKSGNFGGVDFFDRALSHLKAAP